MAGRRRYTGAPNAASKMTQSTKVTHLWDSEHSEEGQGLVSNNETYCDMLINNSIVLSKRLKLSEVFWSLLLQCGVVDERTKVKIEARNTEKAQVSSLVNHIMDLEVYKLHGFIWALVNSHQHQIAEQLGFSLHDYFDAETFMKYSAFRCPACQEFYTKAYIMTGCGHYICAPCVKGAQFICKNDQREDMTCPVPDCNKITEVSPTKGSIGLDEDVTFKDLCQVLVKELMEGTDCSDCKTLIPASAVKHHCSDCDRVLCTDCTTKHKKDERDHNVLPYGRQMKMKKEDKIQNGSDEKLQEYIDKLKDDASCFDSRRSTLGQHANGVKEYIRKEQQRMKQVIDDWAEENLEQYSTMQQQVEQRLKQSLQWERAASELSIHLKMRPWLLNVGKDMETILEKNAEFMSSDDVNIITELDSGCSIPTLLTPVPSITTPDGEAIGPNIGEPGAKQVDAQLKSGASTQKRKGPRLVLSKPPEKAKYCCQFGKDGDESRNCCIKVVGTAEGEFLLLTKYRVFSLVQEPGTLALRFSCIQDYFYFENLDIAAAEDGTWILSQKNHNALKIHDRRLRKYKYLSLSFEKKYDESTKKWNDVLWDAACSVAINNDYIFLYSGSKRIVKTFSRDLEPVGEYDLSPTITKSTDYSGLIHLTEGGKLLQRSPAENRIYILDLETKEVTFFTSVNGATFSCVTSVGGGEYILAGEWNGNCISVFTDQGTFVRHLGVEQEDDRICSMAVSPRKGKPKQLAVCRSINQKTMLRFYTLV